MLKMPLRQDAMRSDLVAHINTDDLLHNYRVLRARCGPKVRFCAPLKADAYGHGLRTVAPVLREAGADCAAVATLQEAVELRETGWDRPILVLGNVLAVPHLSEREARFSEVTRHHLSLTVADASTIDCIVRHGNGSRIDVHLKVDTGMGRMGATPMEAVALLRRSMRVPQIRLAGIYSHFATADLSDQDMAQQQLRSFRELLDGAGRDLPVSTLRHLANSAATITLPDAHFDMVRPGLALYGYLPSAHMASQIDLRPVLRLVTHVTLVKELPAGHCIGYGRTYVTKRPTRVGILPAGYSDGYVRALSNLAVVGFTGGDAPVIGRISMDQLAVDLTDLPDAVCGSEATLIDNRPDRPNSVQSIADRLGTIPYEVTCLLGRRIDRVAVGKSCAKPPLVPSNT